MARQWRIEYPGAIYHVLSRGNHRQDIFQTDDDRHLFLELLGELSSRFNVSVYAYVLMSNHYHLLIKAHEKNLSRAMQWFGTTYTRHFQHFRSSDKQVGPAGGRDCEPGRVSAGSS